MLVYQKKNIFKPTTYLKKVLCCDYLSNDHFDKLKHSTKTCFRVTYEFILIDRQGADFSDDSTVQKKILN